jgi:hypothetical protein
MLANQNAIHPSNTRNSKSKQDAEGRLNQQIDARDGRYLDQNILTDDVLRNQNTPLPDGALAVSFCRSNVNSPSSPWEIW